MPESRKEILKLSRDCLGEKYCFDSNTPEPIGSGGTGLVYAVRQIFDQQKRISTVRAIKFFLYRDDLVSENGFVSNENFITEIVNISRFNHQNILKVVDGNFYRVEHEDNVISIPYIVTELIEDCTLESIFDVDCTDICNEFLRNEENIFSVFEQIARGLCYLHSYSFYHCDIAPKNIFIKKNNENEWLAIIGDLGAGRTLTDNSFEEAIVIGTKNYMPDEIKDKKNKRVSWEEFRTFQPKWDIYSLKQTLLWTIEKCKNKEQTESWHLERLRERISNTDYNCMELILEDIEHLRPSSNKIFNLDELSEASSSMRQTLIPINPAFLSYNMYKISKHYMLIRLLNVPQLLEGAATFPGANHTRYEHSLGTYELMRKAMLALLRNKEYVNFLDERMVIVGLLSALLSSIVHFPLSYAAIELESEEKGTLQGFSNRKIFRKIMNYSKNDQISLLDTINQLFEKYYINEADLEYVIFGKDIAKERDEKLEILFNLLNSSVGVRVVDYLTRDSYHIGIKYNVDTDSLFSYMSIKNGEFCIKQSGISAAEQVIINRYWLFKRIYWCEPNRANVALIKFLFYTKKQSEGFVDKLINRIPELDRLKIEKLLIEDKNIETAKKAKDIIDFLNKKGEKRYKRIYVIGKDYAAENAAVIWNKVSEMNYSEKENIRVSIENRLMELLEIKEKNDQMPIVLLDFPYEKDDHKLGNDIKVLRHDGSEIYLPRVSTTIKGVSDSFKEQLTLLRVYIRPDIYENYIKDNHDRDNKLSECIGAWLYSIL